MWAAMEWYRNKACLGTVLCCGLGKLHFKRGVRIGRKLTRGTRGVSVLSFSDWRSAIPTYDGLEDTVNLYVLVAGLVQEM